MFDFDPPTEFEAKSSTRAESRDSQETSVTPTASPRRRSAPLTAAVPTPTLPAVEEENREPGQTQAEQQFMSLVGADLPSHRRAWKNDRASWKVFTDASNVPGDRSNAEDDDAASDLSSESELIKVWSRKLYMSNEHSFQRLGRTRPRLLNRFL